ncbi:MAG: hypothetical protein ACXWVL_09075, partial [Rhodoplanes sp.]
MKTVRAGVLSPLELPNSLHCCSGAALPRGPAECGGGHQHKTDNSQGAVRVQALQPELLAVAGTGAAGPSWHSATLAAGGFAIGFVYATALYTVFTSFLG